MTARIGHRRAFERLRRDGRRIRPAVSDPVVRGCLWCRFIPDDAADPPRVAFAIGRDVGSAVVRNRIRRRLRELLRQVNLPTGWYLIGVMSAALSFEQLRTGVEGLAVAAAQPGSRSRPDEH